MNLRILAVIIAAAEVLGTAGCELTKTADHRVPASWSAFAPCPAGDDGRIQDKWLRWPNQWVCVR